MMKKILLVEDDITFSLMMRTWLGKKGYEVECVSSVVDAKKALLKNRFDVVLSDLRLPDYDGMELLRWMKGENVDSVFIIMTSYADIQTAVESIKLGAFDFISKPVNPDKLLEKIQEALSLNSEAQCAEAKTTRENNGPVHIEGKSEKAKVLHEYIRLVAPTSMSILINGASGTGKEFIARMIHKESARKDKPFVAVDCGAIPRELASSELFGHVKGSFTGAIADKTGHFVEANGGTLFLDEIGNLPYEIQVQLLRALQERKVKPVGSNSEIKVDVRIIAATNEDMDLALEQNAFREDLYHRINEFSIQVPTLSERKEDIALFANHFLDLANEELNKSVVGFEKETLDVFQNYSWPGNLRQMKNVVKRATLLAKGSLIGKDELPHELLSASERKSEPASGSLRDENHERILIVNALKNTNNNKTKAAVLLKIDRKTLYNKMKLYGLD
jgi:two-component system response regulator HydG